MNSRFAPKGHADADLVAKFLAEKAVTQCSTRTVLGTKQLDRARLRRIAKKDVA